MTLEEILEIEEHNQAEIHLLRQGMFYRVHERSCVAFQEIEKYQIIKKRSATLGVEYIYSGFPSSKLEKITRGRKFTELSPDHVIVSGRAVSDDELLEVKKSTELSVAVPTVKTPAAQTASPPLFTPQTPPAAAVATQGATDKERALIEMIRCFDVEKATPAMCQIFLSMIKTQL